MGDAGYGLVLIALGSNSAYSGIPYILVSTSYMRVDVYKRQRLQRGKEIAEQINILGDDGVPVEYHVTFWKSEDVYKRQVCV